MLLVTYTENKGPDETLQEYVHKLLLTWLKKQWELTQLTLLSCVIIFVFIKHLHLYNKDIRQYDKWQCIKTISTLADAFRLAHHSLLKLKEYEGTSV